MPNPSTKEPKEASETPRSDVAWDDSSPLYKLSDAERKEFAQDLERENAALRALITKQPHTEICLTRCTSNPAKWTDEFCTCWKAGLAAIKPAGE